MPQTIQMANLGMADSLILMVMALVVFGPRRLPQIGRQIGKLMYEFRKASNDFKFQMEEELRNAEEADRRKQDEERMKALAVTATAPKLTAPEPADPVTLDATVPPAAIESPYPGEEVYPPVITPPTEPPAEETYPRIQPPSTGEQVAAARPNSLTALAQAAKELAATAPAEAAPEASSEPAATAAVAEQAPEEQGAPQAQPVPAPEQAAHHA
ncbi:MAG TPA: twin-arginine translocase TatA/TatE family subunit [Terracidiphilus sp.]|nr:twin-arginine translocase TatA/TatE family subunit [Terracidiphilus sp.]